MGEKALHKTIEQERETLLTCLTMPNYRTYIPFPLATSILNSASNYWWEKAWMYGIREWYMKWKAGNRARDEH